MSNMCKALDSQDKPNKCYMSLACCHEMLEESRCIYVDKVKLVFRTHSFLLQPTNCYISWINGCIDRIDRARKYLQKRRYVQCGAVQIVVGHTFHSSPSIHRCRRRVCSPLPTPPGTSHRCSTRIYATYLLIYTIYLRNISTISTRTCRSPPSCRRGIPPRTGRRSPCRCTCRAPAASPPPSRPRT